jgi:hypothetical protein
MRAVGREVVKSRLYELKEPLSSYSDDFDTENVCLSLENTHLLGVCLDNSI